jgi:hypothetical protein
MSIVIFALPGTVSDELWVRIEPLLPVRPTSRTDPEIAMIWVESVQVSTLDYPGALDDEKLR